MGAPRIVREPAALPGRRRESEHAGRRPIAPNALRSPASEAHFPTVGVAPAELAARATAMLELGPGARLAPLELARWLVAESLAVEHAGRLVATERGRELAEALSP
jgi:hypothetical protein